MFWVKIWAFFIWFFSWAWMPKKKTRSHREVAELPRIHLKMTNNDVKFYTCFFIVSIDIWFSKMFLSMQKFSLKLLKPLKKMSHWIVLCCLRKTPCFLWSNPFFSDYILRDHITSFPCGSCGKCGGCDCCGSCGTLDTHYANDTSS